MVELVTGVTLAARVVFFVASYRGYKAESHKEDDRAVRTWIMETLNGIREHGTNIMTMHIEIRIHILNVKQRI